MAGGDPDAAPPVATLIGAAFLAGRRPFPLAPRGAALHPLVVADDARGRLVAMESGPQVPFPIVRAFQVSGVPADAVRGRHAHKACHQFLVALSGAVTAIVDDGHVCQTVRLDSPAAGLHVPPGLWGVQFDFTSDAVMLVLASHGYDAADYIDDYEAFRAGTARHD